MSQQDILIVAAVGGAAYLLIREAKRRRAEMEALEAQNAALEAQLAARAGGGRRGGTRWEDVALGSVQVVGAVLRAIF